ncbi:MAG: inositol monophosphatase family protein [Gammaproteobacteria bacterium]|jgi:myo-inositol-1(or 4)-monophosphatase|nr:inositol monophosphatase family protein [Gammaproteobacteria bacterium]
MQALLNTAVEAVRKGGDTTLRYFGRPGGLEIVRKSQNEYVTQADHASEQIIIETIHQRYPEHAILAEESGGTGSSDFEWIIDPLDGTTNFIHGFPVFAVSVGLRVKGRLEVGVVYDPTRQEMFTAIRGQGAQLDGRRIRVSGRKTLDGALIGTGFPYRASRKWMSEYLEMFQDVMQQAAGVRRPGAAALDLSYVAAGRLDGFWEFGLQIWDIAAGVLLIREAGGLVSNLTDDGDYLETGNLIAGTPKVHKELERMLRPRPSQEAGQG